MNYRILALAIVIVAFLLGTSEAQSKEPESVTIGKQIWMTKNLDVDKYQNGDPIPQVTDSEEWANLTTGAWCYYDNDPKNGKIYGKLYNGFAVNDPRCLAPLNWHVASDADWTILTDFLGGEGTAGGKLKEVGTKHWKSPNIDATNKSGFTALPGGLRYYDATGDPFSKIGISGFWWSATINVPFHAKYRFIDNDSSAVYNDFFNMRKGYSVRCVNNYLSVNNE